MSALFLALALAARAAPPDTPSDPPAETVRPPFGCRVDLGFPHWYADDYLTAEQARSASLGVGVQPWTRWVEVWGRWEWMHLSVDPSHPDHEALDGRWVDFTSAGLGLTRSVTRGLEQVRVSATVGAVLPHVAGGTPTVGFGGGYALYYVLDAGKPGGLWLGPFLDVRENTIRFRRPDGSLTDWQVDAFVVLGVAAFR